MLTYPFLIIQKRLQTEVTELREIDWYLDQDSETAKDIGIKTSPAAFIEFLSPLETKDLAVRIQQSVVEFNVHLLTSNVMDSGKRMLKNKSTDHMVIFDKVYKCLSGFSSLLSYLEEFGALNGTKNDKRIMNSISRNGVVSPHRVHKTLMKSTQKFKTVLWDHGAVKTYTKLDPQPALVALPIVDAPDVVDTYGDEYDETYA